MNDHSPNDAFHQSSFLQGHNAEYIEQLYARYADNPGAVDESWQAFFRSLGDTEADAKAEAAATKAAEEEELAEEAASTAQLFRLHGNLPQYQRQHTIRYVRLSATLQKKKSLFRPTPFFS